MHDVILMALSTLPRTIGSFSFSCDQDVFSLAFPAKNIDKAILQFEDCKYQLESPLRMILENSQSESKTIILLCTPETLKKSDYFDFSPINYFFQRLIDLGYIKGYTANDLEAKISDTENLIDCCGNKGNLSISVIKIKPNVEQIDDNTLLTATRKAVSLTRNAFIKNTIKSTNLYFIAHGGFRAFYLTISAMISILKEDGIEPAAILSTDMSSHKITSEMPAFHLFEFVSGMNEFLLYGHVKTLEQYYCRVMKRTDVYSDSLINAMKKISEGTNFSDASTYYEGVVELRDLIRGTVEQKSKVMQRPEFETFKEYIVKDYGEILEGSDLRYIDIIERCKNKRMFQQALTFIESKIPEDFFKQQIFHYDENSLIYSGNGTEISFKQVLQAACSYENDPDPIHVYMQHMIYAKYAECMEMHKKVSESEMIKAIAKNKSLFFDILKCEEDETDKKIKDLKEAIFDGEKTRFHAKPYPNKLAKKLSKFYGPNSNEGSRHNDQKNEQSECLKILKKQGYNGEGKEKIPFESKLEGRPDKDQYIAGITMTLWALLKYCRNRLNHGDGRSFSMDELETVVDIFIEFTKYLYKVPAQGLCSSQMLKEIVSPFRNVNRTRRIFLVRSAEIQKKRTAKRRPRSEKASPIRRSASNRGKISARSRCMRKKRLPWSTQRSLPTQ